MRTNRCRSNVPIGLSFEISDLAIARDWSSSCDLRMFVELDYCVAGRECEEVLALYPRDRDYCCWIMWCSRSRIVLQPRTGRAVQFKSMKKALEHASHFEQMTVHRAR
jgi:hypothetical protein